MVIFLNKIVLLSLNIVVVPANSVDPDEMKRYAPLKARALLISTCI